MISIYLMGGLGNQLFQIFATIAYGIQYNHLFVFPYSDKLVTGKVRPTYWHSFLQNLNMFTTNNQSGLVSNQVLQSFPRLSENGFAYTEIPAISNTQNFTLFGYYQSYKYFEKYQDKIYSMIMLSEKQYAIKTQYADYFFFYDGKSSLDNIRTPTFVSHSDVLTYARTPRESSRMNVTISMHFRLGDYKEKQQYHPIMPTEYYVKSLEYILKNSCVQGLSGETTGEFHRINADETLTKTSDIRVLYFCEAEDNSYVSSIINYLGNVFSEYTHLKFIKVDDTIADWEQMLLMSCCDCNIIANSSFSWWGAYLNKNPSKIVCYPSKWFGIAMNNVYTDDLFPQSWQKIQIY